MGVAVGWDYSAELLVVDILDPEAAAAIVTEA